MFLSKRSNGIYYLWYKDENGRKRKVSTRSKLKSDALRFLQDFKQKDHEHRVRLRCIYLGQFISAFLTHSKCIHSPKTQGIYGTALREFLKDTGDMPLAKIGVREIEGFILTKKTEASERTSATYFTHLASAFEIARRWNWITSNPFREVKKPKLPELQPIFLYKEEFGLLLQTIEDIDFRDLLITAVSTGMRLGEIISLEWTDINFAEKTILVQSKARFSTKSRRNRTIPVSEQLWALLATRKERASCELVFHKSIRVLRAEAVSKYFKAAIRDAGLDERLHFHSLRHSHASWLVQDGVSLYEVQKLLGHSNISVTEKYSHLMPQKLHDTVNRICIPVN
jgi:site-specific recombinase XerD